MAFLIRDLVFTVISGLMIVTILFHKIPPHLPFPKGGKIPLFGKEGKRGDFVKDVYAIMRLLISETKQTHLRSNPVRSAIAPYRTNEDDVGPVPRTGLSLSIYP